MYGTVARIKIQPDKVDEALELMKNTEESSDSPGAVGYYLYQMDSDPSEFFLVVQFEDKDSYFANANDPQTNAEFQEMAKYFAEEPQWHDGEVVYNRHFD